MGIESMHKNSIKKKRLAHSWQENLLPELCKENKMILSLIFYIGIIGYGVFLVLAILILLGFKGVLKYCAWCGKLKSIEIWKRKDVAFSHGICKKCRLGQERKWEAKNG